MDTNSKIELFRALGNSLMFTTSQNRMGVRNYLINSGMEYISGHLQYDGSGNAFAREIYLALERQKKVDPHICSIIDLAIEMEDNPTILNQLKAVQENNNRTYS
jgi:hypothetical protein